MDTLNEATVPMIQTTKRFTGSSRTWVVSTETTCFQFNRAVAAWDLSRSFYKDSHLSFEPNHYGRWSNEMPRAKAKTEDKKDVKMVWKGFLNIKLSDAEFEAIDAITPAIDLGEYCKWLCDFGKVTIAFNASNSTYNCTVVFHGGRLDGYGISSFSDTFNEAVSITAYKIEHYFDTVSLEGASSGKARRG